MIPVYSSYQSRSIEVAASDVGYATGILTAGRKARAILYLSLYSRTNTAASSVSFGVSGVNEENRPGSQWQEAANGANPYYPVTYPNTTVQSATQVAPDVMAPVHQKQNNQMPLIIPPEHALSMLCTDTNLNGTVIVNIITAEIGE